MPNADPLLPRPTLVSSTHLARALDALRADTASNAEVWRRLTQAYTVDLDAVAALMPAEEPEPVWLAARR